MVLEQKENRVPQNVKQIMLGYGPAIPFQLDDNAVILLSYGLLSRVIKTFWNQQ